MDFDLTVMRKRYKVAPMCRMCPNRSFNCVKYCKKGIKQIGRKLRCKYRKMW